MLYEIIKRLEGASGTIEKQAILDENKDNTLLKNFVKATLDPGINYYQKKLPKGVNSFNGDKEFAQIDIDMMLRDLADRKFTGLDAMARLGGHASALNAEGREMLQFMLDHKLGKSSVGETMALKTWPGLFFTVPYQRCSLLDVKARERFGKLKRFYVQTKADGSFAYVVKRLDGTVDVITRQGSKYPQWFAQALAEKLAPGDVLVGELLVDKFLQVGLNEAEMVAVERKTANGLLNSALKDGDRLDDSYGVRMEAWDYLTQEEFEAGKSSLPYEQRLTELKALVDSLGANVSIIYTKEVSSLDEAFVVYQEHLQRGLEGCIIKDPDSLWKDGTSKEMAKLKIKFQVEMRCTGVYEGEGKAENKLGGIKIASEDGLIECQCGSGFNDEQRSVYWSAPDLVIGHVITVEANDITQAKVEGKKPALSLPIFVEVRSDKTAADSAERIHAQLEAAKQGA